MFLCYLFFSCIYVCMSIEILGHANRKYLHHRNKQTRAYKYRDTSIDTYELAKLDHTSRLYSNFKGLKENNSNWIILCLCLCVSMHKLVSMLTFIDFYARWNLAMNQLYPMFKFGKKNNNGSTFLCSCSYISMLAFVCFYAQKNYHIES